jgi:hypothetical protein
MNDHIAQLPLDFSRAVSAAPMPLLLKAEAAMRKRAVALDLALQLVRTSAWYRPTFSIWLEVNWHIAHAFVREAWMVAQRTDHYSAYTIIEVLRHHTRLAEGAGSPFKINNIYRADLSRLFVSFFPEYKDLFSRRIRGV